MIKLKRKTSLVGAGGMASEIVSLFGNEYCIEYLYDDINTSKVYKNKYIVSDKFKPDNYYNIAVGYPETKVKIVNNIKNDIKWAIPLIHKNAIICHNINIGLGSVIYPFVLLTSNIIIGFCATINSHVKIGHDCKIGSMFHASPGATVSGYVTIGHRVFLGANSCIKEYVKICDDVIIGAGAVVVKDITEPGKYAGVPARKI